MSAVQPCSVIAVRQRSSSCDSTGPVRFVLHSVVRTRLQAGIVSCPGVGVSRSQTIAASHHAFAISAQAEATSIGIDASGEPASTVVPGGSGSFRGG